MAGEHVWQGACIAGDMCGREASMAGGMHGRGHAWKLGMHDRRWGETASYWNAVLFTKGEVKLMQKISWCYIQILAFLWMF